MDRPRVNFIEIQSAAAPLFHQWLDLYETAFPPNEKMLVSAILKMLKQPGAKRPQHFIAITNDRNEFAGMMLYEINPADGLALLWYLAIAPEMRSQGLGSIVYQELLRRLDPAACKALFYEVEIPGRKNKEEAERRIAFYRRNGAFLLEGIHYMQYIGWHHPPTPMHLMVHPLQPLNAGEAFDLAKSCFGAALQKRGIPSLS